jgi:hypothetical protein
MTTDTLTESQTIELESLTASTIRNVTLYPARAEVTRAFKFAVNAAQTRVHIDGLPTIMDRESLRYVVLENCLSSYIIFLLS